MKISRKVKVTNRLGLHTRPATAIVRMLQNCRAQVSFTHQSKTVNAKSLLNILMLAAPKNSSITITVEGLEADISPTMDQLVHAFSTGFGEAD